MTDLLDIMARLRDPVSGCPWDLEQDFDTISPHTIEEAYEVDEAIEAEDHAALQDELGDLLFQVVFQARIGEERGLFDFDLIVGSIVDKLIRRHPHVFADAAKPGSSADQLKSWEEIKAAERAEAARSASGQEDPFSGIPRHLPALARSAKIASRLGRTGAQASSDDRQKQAELAPRIEEIDRVSRGSAESSERENAIQLVGEGLRSWVMLARDLGVDPEQALRRVDDERMDRVRGTPRSG